MTLKLWKGDDTIVLAGFRGEKCLALCSMDYSEESTDRFKARCKERGLEVREVTFREALAGAGEGFKKSIRYLRTAMRNRHEMH